MSLNEIKPVASVVIPSWNGASFVGRTLDRLTECEGLSFEVLVVDHGRLNRDTERVLARFEKFPWIRYIGLDEQLGFTGAVNHGVSLAASDLVAVICNDVLVEKDWLKELVSAYAPYRAQGRSPVLFSLVNRGGEIQDLRIVRTNFWFRGLFRQEPKPRETFLFPDGSSFLFDRAVYGLPFDGAYFLYHEDVYIGWRARLRGEEVRMVPSSRADNFDGGTTKRTPYRTSYFSERNRWINYLIFISGANLIRMAPFVLGDSLVKLIFGTNRRAKMHAWSWVLFHLPEIQGKRKAMQATRKASDAEILPFLSSTYLDLRPGHPANRLIAFCVRLVGLPFGP